MLTLEKGRPADVAGRLEKEQRVYELLDDETKNDPVRYPDQELLDSCGG